MVLQERDVQVLINLAHYFMLNSRQIRELCFPEDSTGRITRRRLMKMMGAEYVRKRNLLVVNPRDGSTAPVYHLARTGREFIASHLDDERLLAKPVEPSQPQHLNHYVAVSETHRLFDRAAEQCDDVTILQWVNEDEYINPEEQDRSSRRKLRTTFSGEKNVVCLPDAALLLKYAEQSVVVYVEQDRDTFFHDRVAARKSPGYRNLLALQAHRQHFPGTTLDFFYVLFIAPTRKRVDQLRKSFSKKNADLPAQKIYRFAALDELEAGSLFFDPLLYCCHHEDRVSLIRKTNPAAQREVVLQNSDRAE